MSTLALCSRAILLALLTLLSNSVHPFTRWPTQPTWRSRVRWCPLRTLGFVGAVLLHCDAPVVVSRLLDAVMVQVTAANTPRKYPWWLFASLAASVLGLSSCLPTSLPAAVGLWVPSANLYITSDISASASPFASPYLLRLTLLATGDAGTSTWYPRIASKAVRLKCLQVKLGQ